MPICKRCLVTGRVQGVFFRAAARDRAQSLHVTGHARNMDDGRVEVLACGEKENVDQLVEWLWEGSPAAEVEAVATEDVDVQPPEDFRAF